MVPWRISSAERAPSGIGAVLALASVTSQSIVAPSRSQPGGVFEVLRLEHGIGAEIGMARYVGRVFARRGLPPERLGHRPDVMRAGAAADAQVAHAQPVGGLGEVGDLGAGTGDGTEREAHRAGGGPPAPPKPSLALGVFEGSPPERAPAYTMFTNGGSVRPLQAITR